MWFSCNCDIKCMPATGMTLGGYGLEYETEKWLLTKVIAIFFFKSLKDEQW